MLALILSTMLVSQATKPKALNPPPTHWFYHPKAGDKAYLFPQFPKRDLGEIPVLTFRQGDLVQAKETYLTWARLSREDDEAGLAKMFDTSKILHATAGVRIEIIKPMRDVVEDDGYAVIVRFLEGTWKGAVVVADLPDITDKKPSIDGMSWERFKGLRKEGKKQRVLDRTAEKSIEGLRSSSFGAPSHQCGATTLQGTPCKRLVNGVGYCFQHR